MYDVLVKYQFTIGFTYLCKLGMTNIIKSINANPHEFKISALGTFAKTQYKLINGWKLSCSVQF